MHVRIVFFQVFKTSSTRKYVYYHKRIQTCPTSMMELSVKIVNRTQINFLLIHRTIFFLYKEGKDERSSRAVNWTRTKISSYKWHCTHNVYIFFYGGGSGGGGKGGRGTWRSIAETKINMKFQNLLCKFYQ